MSWGLMIVKLAWKMLVIELTFRSSRSQTFFKIGVLKNFANFTGKHLCWSLLLIKLFSCEFFELFKSIFFYRTPPVAASVLNRSRSTPSIKKAFRKISENSQENICSDIDVFRCILQSFYLLPHRCFSVNFILFKNNLL